MAAASSIQVSPPELCMHVSFPHTCHLPAYPMFLGLITDKYSARDTNTSFPIALLLASPRS